MAKKSPDLPEQRELEPNSHNIPTDRNGLPVIDKDFGDMAFQVLFESLTQKQEDHPIVPHAPFMQEYRETIGRLDQEFRTRRDDWARRSYTSKASQSRHLNESEIQKYVKSSAERPENQDRYSRDPIPDALFFQKDMLPTIKQMASTPKELEAMARHGFDMIESLLVWSFVGNEGARCASHVPRGFFAVPDAEHYDSWTGGSCHGQFGHFYQKYGPEFAAMIAKYQGWNADKHYEGGHSYCKSIPAIEGDFGALWKICPKELQPRLAEVCGIYFGANLYWGEHLLYALAPTLKGFIEKGKTDLIATYLDILSLRFDMSSRVDSDSKSSYFLFNVDDMIAECEALKDHPLRNEMLNMAKALMSDYGTTRELSFIASLEDEELKYFGNNIGKLVGKFEKAGLSQEKIREILTFNQKHTWLGRDASKAIMTHWPEIEERFPGGVDGLVQYLEKLKPAKQCIKMCVHAVTGYRAVVPKDMSDPEFENGIALVQSLGDAASKYFAYDMFGGMYRPENETPEQRQRRIGNALKLAKVAPEKLDGGQLREKAFEWGINRKSHGGRLAEIARAIRVLTKNAEHYKKNHTSEADWEVGNAINHTTEAYEKIWRTMQEYQKKKENKGKSVPTHAEMAEYASFLVMQLGDRYQTLVHTYCEAVDKNADPFMAMMMPVMELIDRIKNLDEIDISALPIPEEMRLNFGRWKTTMSSMNKTKKKVEDIAENLQWRVDIGRRRNGGWGRHGNRITTSSERKMEKEAWQDGVVKMQVHQLKVCLAEVEKIRADEEIAKHLGKTLDDLENEIRGILNKAAIHDIGDFAIQKSDYHLEGSDFFQGANDTTRFAIAGMAFVMALQGAKSQKGIGLEQLPDIYDGRGVIALPGKVRDVKGGRFLDAVARNMARLLPVLEQQVLDERKKSAGKLPIGVKIHTEQPMNHAILDFLTQSFGLGQTPFRLIHANDSMLLPPLPTTLEQKMLITILEFFGCVDPKARQIQTALAGRLEPHAAAIEGSSILLSTVQGQIFGKGAFSTTQDEKTGARIMAFDDGVKISGLPFDLPNARGRTDILARRALEDIDLHHIVGNVLHHEQFGGPFAALEKDFRMQFQKILAMNGLDRALHMSAWVQEHVWDEARDTPDQHEAMIGKFTQAWMESSNRPDYGVIRQVGQLITQTAHAIQRLQPGIVKAQADEFEKLLRY